MGLLAGGQSWLQTVFEAEGQSITYHRGATTLGPFAANPDESDETGLDTFGAGQSLQMATRAWAFAWAELQSLDPATPRDGDQIRLAVITTAGTVTHQWTVRADAAGRYYQELDNRRMRIAANTAYDGPVS